MTILGTFKLTSPNIATEVGIACVCPSPTTNVISLHCIVTTFHHPSHAKDTCKVPQSTSVPLFLSLMKANPIARVITIDPPSPPLDMEEEEVEVGCEEAYSLIPNPLQCFTKLTLFQADLIYNSLTTFFSPISCLLSILHESYHRAEETKDIVESTIHKVPSTITHGRTFMLKTLSLGFLGAAYVCLVLMVVLVLAVVLGVGLLQLWVDQPVFVRESLYFDYTEPHPKAVFHFCNVGAERNNWMKKLMGVPIGHTFHVTLVLLMPKSDFNRDIRVFQV